MEENKKQCFCQYCGSKIEENTHFCSNCGGNLKSDSQVVKTNTQQDKPKGREVDKFITLALCLLFGCLGVHKFYENKIGMGILYIFTFGLFGIGVFIDIILILIKPDRYYV